MWGGLKFNSGLSEELIAYLRKHIFLNSVSKLQKKKEILKRWFALRLLLSLG